VGCLEFEHHDGDENRDHAVAERLEPALVHAALPATPLTTA
jgi:hypothetical protein